MKEEKPWSRMNEENWKRERERIRRIQEVHFKEGMEKNDEKM